MVKLGRFRNLSPEGIQALHQGSEVPLSEDDPGLLLVLEPFQVGTVDDRQVFQSPINIFHALLVIIVGLLLLQTDFRAHQVDLLDLVYHVLPTVELCHHVIDLYLNFFNFFRQGKVLFFCRLTVL